MAYCCCIRREKEEMSKLRIMDLEKIIADHAWKRFRKRHCRCLRFFLNRSDFLVDVPMRHFRFETIKQDFMERSSPGEGQDGRRIKDSLSQQRSATDGAKKEELVSKKGAVKGTVELKTRFHNDTPNEQTYHFKLEKARKANVTVTMHRGFSIGGKARFDLKFAPADQLLKKAFKTGAQAGAELDVRYTITKTEGESIEETSLFETNSDIKVEVYHSCDAEIVLDEVAIDYDFKVKSIVTLLEGGAPVTVRRKKDGCLFYTYMVNSLRTIFDDYEKAGLVKILNDDDASRAKKKQTKKKKEDGSIEQDEPEKEKKEDDGDTSSTDKSKKKEKMKEKKKKTSDGSIKQDEAEELLDDGNQSDKVVKDKEEKSNGNDEKLAEDSAKGDNKLTGHVLEGGDHPLIELNSQDRDGQTNGEATDGKDDAHCPGNVGGAPGLIADDEIEVLNGRGEDTQQLALDEVGEKNGGDGEQMDGKVIQNGQIQKPRVVEKDKNKGGSQRMVFTIYGVIQGIRLADQSITLKSTPLKQYKAWQEEKKKKEEEGMKMKEEEDKKRKEEGEREKKEEEGQGAGK